MKRFLNALPILVVAAALLVVVPISKHRGFAVHAQEGCSNATLTGNYGFEFSGFQIQQNTSVPFYGAGLATFKDGNVSANFATSVNGSGSTNNPYTATYRVNRDCTVSLTATPGSGGDNFVGVIVDGGAEVLATDITDMDTLNVHFKKQEKSNE